MLEGDLIHRPFESLSQFIDRQNRYTSLQGQELFERFGASKLAEAKQQLRWKLFKRFWKLYVKKQGFKDGMHGLIFSVLFAWVDWLVWAKYWELAHAPSR